jgi:hypothetical protein
LRFIKIVNKVYHWKIIQRNYHRRRRRRRRSGKDIALSMNDDIKKLIEVIFGQRVRSLVKAEGGY